MERRRPTPTTTPRKLTPDEQAFVDLFFELEQSRRDLYAALTECLGFLNRHPALRQTWDQFIETGGATAAELRDQYRGTRRSSRKVFVQKHMIRCVVNNAPTTTENVQAPPRKPSRPNKVRRGYYNNEGPEAA